MTDDRPQEPTLHVLATPLGNLGDLSARARALLQRADVIFAEDTRVTQHLLEHVAKDAPRPPHARLVSAHQHNEHGRAAQVVEAVAAGQRVLLVSDAGTPLVSDPGTHIVREVLDAGFAVVSVPGPSAVVTALAASGFHCVPFAFFGFLARKGEARVTQLAQMRHFAGTLVLFETKERIGETLADLANALGADTEAALGRELTKLHETYYRGTLGALHTQLKDEALRGEMTLVIAPRAAQHAGNEDVDTVVAELLADPRPAPVRVRELVLRCGVSRKEAYRLLAVR